MTDNTPAQARLSITTRSRLEWKAIERAGFHDREWKAVNRLCALAAKDGALRESGNGDGDPA